MINQYGSGRGRKKSICSAQNASWVVIVALACIAGGALYCLQGAYKEVASLRDSSDGNEVRRRGLQEEVDLHRQRLKHSEQQALGAIKERDELRVAHKEDIEKLSQKLLQAEQNATGTAAALAAATRKAGEAEKEVKEITVKAGTCQQQFAALNADCATLRQGLANLGLSSRTTEAAEKQQLPQQGALDPRGGIEAAKVLKSHSQQPWKEGGAGGAGGGDVAAGSSGAQGASSRVQVQQPQLLHDGSAKHVGTDVDETGPGLEKALVQGGLV